jgi:hypothetical protein
MSKRRRRVGQLELVPRSKRATIEVEPTHRLVELTDRLDWDDLEARAELTRPARAMRSLKFSLSVSANCTITPSDGTLRSFSMSLMYEGEISSFLARSLRLRSAARRASRITSPIVLSLVFAMFAA